MAGLVVVSDTHFSNRKQFGKVMSTPVWRGCNSRFHEIAFAFQSAFEYAIRNDCEAIVVPGDIFHERGLIKVPVYNAVYELFDQVSSQSKIKLILMPGNHDMVDVRAMYGTEGLHSLFAMNAMTVVADKPSHIPLDDFSLYMVPFSSDPDEVINGALSISNFSNGSKPSILFLHHSIEGAETGPSNWKMPHELKVEQIDALEFDLNISGHYHKHQKLSDKTFYAGSLLQNDFGERNYTPGWIHVLPDGTWKHVENTLSPRFKEIETADSREVAALAKSKDYWSVVWTGDSSEKRKWDGENDLSISFKRNIAEAAVSRSQIGVNDSPEASFAKYVKVKTGQDDLALVEYGKQFLV